ncbi:MAG: single-stranded-DNA-specific exonuclease RecJ [Myxococcota bacterium]
MEADARAVPEPADGEPAYRLRRPDPEAARELGRACGVGAAAAQVLLHRGIEDAETAREFLDPRLGGLTRPDGMADREAAVDRIARAVRAGERIAVFGDYDVDGITSCALLSEALEALGGDTVALVANRFDGGYGFSDRALARCREAGARLIVTCDCGSSDHERLSAAARAGLDVVVLDHHLVPEEPLPAAAFINPHRPDCGFPYKGLASAGLALSLAAGVRAALGASLDLRRFLDLVALGTVADVAPLDGDNRRLVRAGLRCLASPDLRPGLIALREAARLRAGAPLGAVDLAFRLAPRLNAPGRLGDAAPTLALLRARSVPQARAAAARVEQLNDERKAIGGRVAEEAVAQVEAIYGPEPETGIVAAGEGWHRGVVGIVAARLADRYGVPAVCIALEDGVSHGSGRAPEGIGLYDALAACRGLLRTFGGHRAAAGLSLAAPRVGELREAFAEATAGCRDRAPGRAPVVDVAIDGATFPLPSLEDMQRLEPLGEANAEPVFVLPNVRVVERRVVGEHHLKLGLELGRARLSAFGRNMAPRLERLGDGATLIGHLRPDTWAGRGLELHLL